MRPYPHVVAFSEQRYPQTISIETTSGGKVMLRKQPQRNPLSTAVIAGLISTLALPAFAQDAAPAAKQEAKTLDTLVVTAQKREEVMQDVPIAVTALSEQTLQDTGVRDIKDLQILVPGLTVTSTQSETITTARIRGIGTVGDNVGLESSVGVVIDGVYRSRNSVGFGDLGELERIEVLKGPQGTLFGKNTSSGVINVVTRKPGFERVADGEVTFGNYSALGLAGSFNTPLGDYAALRVYAAHRNRDGWMSVMTGAGPRSEERDYDQDFDTFRAKLLIAPTENVEIVLSADSTRRDENCCTAVQLVSGQSSTLLNALAGGGAIAPTGQADPWSRVSYSNRSTAQKISDRGVQVFRDSKNFVHAYVAPGGLHLRVQRSGARWRCRLGEDDPIRRHRPSVDALFESVAQAAGANASAALLTGMGDDGARGLLALRKAGAATMVQDEASCVVWGMPGAAYTLGAAQQVLPLSGIASALLASTNPGGA